MNIPSYSKGKNAGKINQIMCQVEGEFSYGDVHPTYPSLRYLQKNTKTGKQQWGLHSAFKDAQHRNRRNALKHYYRTKAKNKSS